MRRAFLEGDRKIRGHPHRETAAREGSARCLELAEVRKRSARIRVSRRDAHQALEPERGAVARDALAQRPRVRRSDSRLRGLGGDIDLDEDGKRMRLVERSPARRELDRELQRINRMAHIRL